MSELTDQEIVDVAGLIHAKWAATMDTLLIVERETDNGTKDWALFHQARAESASIAEAYWGGIMAKNNDQHRAIILKAMGL